MITLDTAWLQAHALPEPSADTDKNKRGRVLVAGGSETVPGALLLTGEAAFRAGAGKVQLAVPKRTALSLGVRMPEAAVFGLAADNEGELSAEAGTSLAEMLDQCDTLALGPGMGPKADTEAILSAVLDAAHEKRLVLDASVLGVACHFASAIRALEGRAVLTPHPGEMALLMECHEDRVSAEPATVAQQAADRFDAVVALKSSETWIAAPGETMLHYTGGGVGLATGGSGDVLAGIIAGLLSRGTAPQVATAWGVWLHGEAGRRIAERTGPLGFLARELLPEIPGLMVSPGTSSQAHPVETR